jgi:phosphoenolpyruvate synthase/pyruvate phosphate dikinase
LAVRSSSTLEDLDKMAGAGLFDSILNVRLEDQEDLKMAIIDVWLSLHTQRAIISRKQNKIKTEHAQMAVLVQQMIDSVFSFIIHSTNPMTDDANQVYIELAVGQGETLASANQTGTPYRLTYDKTTKECKIVSFSSYSFGLFASGAQQDLVKRCLDYSKIPFTQDHESLKCLGAELGKIACAIEKGFGGAP